MPLSASIIGKRLQEARNKKGYKQNYVAEKVDLSDQHLSRIENGSKPIYLHKLAQICDLLDISILELLAEAESPINQTSAAACFKEIIRDCSPETITDMLNTCKTMAEIEKRNKEK
ncbi:MAG: helix-turn-helix transcriptional regulator [Clostridia bacterium]|nr:helix-turn-helix transcriptional regulator [Clostridia bacterium]